MGRRQPVEIWIDAKLALVLLGRRIDRPTMRGVNGIYYVTRLNDMHGKCGLSTS